MIDVCLILEGTYPYVAGGVSTWIHQLINAMGDLRFSIVNIAPYLDPKREFKYKVPPHVLDIQDLFLHDYELSGPLSSKKQRTSNLYQLRDIHQELLEGRHYMFEKVLPLLRDANTGLTIRDIFDTKEGWEMLLSVYRKYGERVSFIDFFWTFRSIYLPLYKIMTAPIPKARLYHTISTGYAGLFASVAKNVNQKKMLLTEHGIYTHERLLEISQANWIYAARTSRFRIEKELPFFKRLWLGLFKTLGGITYHHTDQILTLYEGNRIREIVDGAEPKKISIIPNGVDLELFKEVKKKSKPADQPVVAFIGRVVPIKDVKTFLQSAKMVISKIPAAQFWILGPTDEEPDYTSECIQMVETLGLQDNVSFKGKVNVKEYLAKVDLVVLTSLSEAQPYVILEANAMRVPCVATNVGACRELLEGRLPDDRELGASGLVTNVSSPEDTAEAMIKILKNSTLWQNMGKAGQIRVNRYYDQNDLLSQYLNLYEQSMR